MTTPLTQLADEIRAALTAKPDRAGKEDVCRIVSRWLLNKEFVAQHLKTRAEGANPREVLFEDPALGFCICGHVYDKPASSAPHDHGPSWAIYGQATGVTEMTDWRIVEKGQGERPTLVDPARIYQMKPGDAHFYDVGDVHSPRREAPVKLIRIEGQNLDRIKRSNIKARAAVS